MHAKLSLRVGQGIFIVTAILRMGEAPAAQAYEERVSDLKLAHRIALATAQ